MGRPLGSQNKDKPYRDALRLEQIALANGEQIEHPKGSLRSIAQARLLSAASSFGFQDAKEVADRLDGKVPQAIVGDDDHPPVQLEEVKRTIVDPRNPDSESIPPATGEGSV